MTMKKAEDLAKENWSKGEYYFGYDTIWEQLVEYTRMVQRDALEASAKECEEHECGKLTACHKDDAAMIRVKIKGLA